MLFAFLLGRAFQPGIRQDHGLPARRVLRRATLQRRRGGPADRSVPYHRIHFRQRSKEQILITSNRCPCGLAFLAVAMTGVILLITDVLFGGATTIVVTLGTAILFGSVVRLPLKRRQE